jgi:heat shock protein HtpX
MRTFANNIKTVLLLGALTAFILVAGQMLGGTQGLTIALVFSAVMNFGMYFFSDRIALAAMQAQQVGPDHWLYQLVDRLSQRAGLPTPRVYISPQAAPNAFATGRNPKHGAVCATEGILRVLDRNELAGVMAHEIAHLKHRDTLIQTVAVTLGAVISYLGYMFMFLGPSRDEEGESHPLAAVGGLLVLILGPIAAGLIQAAISRQREYAADTEGAAICGDPMYLASALEKIHAYAHQVPMTTSPAFNALMIAEPKNNFAGGIANLFSTHPPLEKRLHNLIGRESTGRSYSFGGRPSFGW